MTTSTDTPPALVDLAQLIELAPAEIAGLALALRDPAQYVQSHPRLEDRGVTEPCDGLAEIALSDALDASGRLLNLDWKFEVDDFKASVDLILGSDEERWDDLDLEELEDEEDAMAMLETFDEFLYGQGYSLHQIAIDGDCYEFMLIPNPHSKRVDTLLTKLGLDAGRFTGE